MKSTYATRNSSTTVQQSRWATGDCNEVDMNAQWENFEVVTTACSACGVGTESTNMLCEECDADADDEAEMQDAYDMEQELYYDRPNVIAAEVFEDRLSTYRNEH